jgi:hypothetical protein
MRWGVILIQSVCGFHAIKKPMSAFSWTVELLQRVDHRCGLQHNYNIGTHLSTQLPEHKFHVTVHYFHVRYPAIKIIQMALEIKSKPWNFYLEAN